MAVGCGAEDGPTRIGGNGGSGNGGVDPTTVPVGGDLTGVDPSVDTDMDGVPDVIEGTGDADQDGVPAHLDMDEVANPGGGGANPTSGGGSTQDAGPAVSGNCMYPDPDYDMDGDGFTMSTGDCDECDENINPGAFDFPGDDRDADCSGSDATEEEHTCDMGLALDSTDPEDAARAMGLCTFTDADGGSWGVLDARWSYAAGGGNLEDPMMVGLPDLFGAAAPRQGQRLLALSSGVARAPGQLGHTRGCDNFAGGGLFAPPPMSVDPPRGFPKAPDDCNTPNLFGGDPTTYNQVALEVTLRVPTNARSLAFDSIFYTHEYPFYVCSQYNDFFVVLSEPALEGADDGNIVFDTNGDPIGVNSGLLAVCNPHDNPPKDIPCEQGADLLTGTGFGANEGECGEEPSLLGGDNLEQPGGAATGWLQTTAPVEPGSTLTLRFAVWDTNDAVVDSTVLVDNFRWSVEEPKTETVHVPIE